MRRLVLALVFVTACGSASAVQVVRSPSPSPSAVPSASAAPSSPAPQSAFFGVFFDRAGSELAMVDSNGARLTSVTTTEPQRFNAALPWTSATLKRLYYLTDSSDVRFLQPDRATGLTTHVALRPGENAGFSVSPDDTKIAVAVLRYGSASSASTYLGMRMYVEDLSGGGHHVDIYSSTINAEFPIGWTAGHLIVALGTPVCCRAATPNPYGAVEYHIADPATGLRLVTLCHGGPGPVGPPAAIGVICGQSGPPPTTYFHWDGTPCCNPGTAGVGALSPDGNSVAMSAPAPTGIWFSYVPSGTVTGVLGDVAGWLDLHHIVYRDRGTSDLFIAWVFGLHPSARVPMPGASTDYLGTFPTAIA